MAAKQLIFDEASARQALLPGVEKRKSGTRTTRPSRNI